jgi:23S rRNA pseudouridine2457 synthase
MLLAFNKPYGVICQFSPSGDKPTLKDFIATKDIYPAGRLDTDSEGLMLLTDDGILQARVTDPQSKLTKTYWAEVEGQATNESLAPLLKNVDLGDFICAPASHALVIPAPQIWSRNPPVRFRANIPTSWVEITITEGKNRQVRRMTAKIGLPTLRLIRVAIGTLNLFQLGLKPGQSREISQLDMGLGIARRRRKPNTGLKTAID